ncbi:hypothetical protein ACN3E9_06750 [Vibrio pectenicida]|uniref:hypothetical protein n=1 Tax=Vibrio pectenicida TaxID=62763 RepID=UPI003B9CDE34
MTSISPFSPTNYIEFIDLTELHLIYVPVIDWQTILSIEEPKSGQHDTDIMKDQPLSIVEHLVKVFKGDERSQQCKQQWLLSHKQWQRQHAIAQALAKNEPGARLAALKETDAYQTLLNVGIRIDIKAREGVELYVFTGGLMKMPPLGHRHREMSSLNSLSFLLFKMFFNTLARDKVVTLYIYDEDNEHSDLLVRRLHTRMQYENQASRMLFDGKLV